MDANIDAIVATLGKSIGTDAFPEICGDAVAELKGASNAVDAIDPILRLMEDHEDAEFGSPGLLVHFLERFFRKGYESRLLESIRRKPTSHTLWMLNRLMNGVGEGERTLLVAVLRAVVMRSDVTQVVRDSAINYLDFQGDRTTNKGDFS